MSEKASKIKTPSWQPTTTQAKTDSFMSERPFPMPVNNTTLQASQDKIGYRKPQSGDMIENVRRSQLNIQAVEAEKPAKIIQGKEVYRLGNYTKKNFTPRPEKDTQGDGRGLSTSSKLPAKNWDKAQKIETDALVNLEAINDHGNHYAIRPANDPDNAKLAAWANTREAEESHAYTTEVMNARIEEIKKP